MSAVVFTCNVVELAFFSFFFSRTSVGAVLARFGRADLGRGCCPGFRVSGLIFVAIAVYTSEFHISIYFFQLRYHIRCKYIY